MQTSTVKKVVVILAHALVGWALCGSIIGIGRSLTSMETTLIVHAIGAPLIFGILSLLYFRKFNYTTPLQTAVIFTGFAILMDVFVIALLVEKSFVMFTVPIGTWIPFASIFLATYLVGMIFSRKRAIIGA